MENLDFGMIITIILGGVSTFFGVFWRKFKGKLGLVVSLIKESYEAIDSIEKSLKDDKLTKEEIKGIKKELNDVKLKFQEVIKKK